MTQGRPADRNTARQLQILIVEDETAAREASCRYLTIAGYEVATASSAGDAERAAGDTAPDVVICDWRLGGRRDGVDVARTMQQRYGARIVFVTAYPVEELRDRTRDLEVAAYLRKPLSLKTLVDLLDGMSRRSP